MTNKQDRADNKFLRDTNKDLDRLEQAKGNKVKKFLTHKITIAVYIIITLALTAYVTLSIKQAFDNYNQGLIEKGIQLEKDRQKALDKELAARSKQVQQ